MTKLCFNYQFFAVTVDGSRASWHFLHRILTTYWGDHLKKPRRIYNTKKEQEQQMRTTAELLLLLMELLIILLPSTWNLGLPTRRNIAEICPNIVKFTAFWYSLPTEFVHPITHSLSNDKRQKQNNIFLSKIDFLTKMTGMALQPMQAELLGFRTWKTPRFLPSFIFHCFRSS